jgi:hypothetical protein
VSKVVAKVFIAAITAGSNALMVKSQKPEVNSQRTARENRADMTHLTLADPRLLASLEPQRDEQVFASGIEEVGRFCWCIFCQGKLPKRLHPNCTQIAKVPSCKLIERNGGDDGTRTRGLCRDRAAF